MKTHTIKNVPNTGDCLAAVDLLRGHGRVRLRGRGYRHGRKAYHQDLPAKHAERFSVYVEGTPGTGRVLWTYRGCHGGKLRVRLEVAGV